MVALQVNLKVKEQRNSEKIKENSLKSTSKCSKIILIKKVGDKIYE